MATETIDDLQRLCSQYQERDVIVVGVDEWERLSLNIASCQYVAAQADRPAFFWFRDKKIVTPAYMIAETYLWSCANCHWINKSRNACLNCGVAR